jgi:MFS transporter, BCD family, chlorophyll transporter
VIFAAPMESPALFFAGAFGIGLGSGLFAVSTLTAAMTMPAQRPCRGAAGAGRLGRRAGHRGGPRRGLGGALRDVVNGHVRRAGEALEPPPRATGRLPPRDRASVPDPRAVLGPLVRHRRATSATTDTGTGRIGLADFPT